MTTTKATVYTSPGCMKCKVTARELRKAGVEVTETMIHDHPDKVEHMRLMGQKALPLVELHLPDSVMVWSDFRADELKKITNLLKEQETA